ncbi:MAG: ATP-binding protein [Actinomycetota bacterium]|nr:ATP-binding protein [Actinomycetota bacterium]
MSRGRRLSLRGRILSAAIALLSVGLLVLFAAFNIILHRGLEGDADAVLSGRVAAELQTLSVTDGRLTVSEAPDAAAADAQIWVFAGGRALERPAVPPAVDRAAGRLSGGPRHREDVAGQQRRLLSVPVVRNGRQLGAVVAGVSLAPYRRTERIALVASIALAGLLLLVMAFAGRLILTAALRPVGRMTSQAADWSETDLDKRFALGPAHDELTELADTLDGLLDRLAASLRREQRLTAELSHELRTPLSRVLAEAQLALRRDRPAAEYRRVLGAIVQSTGELQQTLETLLLAAQADTGLRRGTSDPADATGALSAIADAHDREFVGSNGSEPVRVGADADLLERILAPLVENACRHGDGRVELRVSRHGPTVRLAVCDEGPGIDPDEVERIFEAGYRGRSASGSAEGSGLGLSLARRLARAAGGDLVARRDGGACFEVTLPRG